MKKFTLRAGIRHATGFAACALFSLAAVSCAEDDTFTYVDAATLELSQQEPVAFPEKGGKLVVKVKTNQTDWTVTSSQPWCVVTQAEGEFTISSEESSTPDALPAATVIVTAGPVYNATTETLAVTQSGLTPATLKVTPEGAIAFPYTGGKQVIAVETNQAKWNVTCDQEWCSVEKGDGTIIVRAKENTAAQSKPQAIISITAGPQGNPAKVTLSATQEGKPEIKGTNLSLNGTANSYVVPAAGTYYFSATMMGNNTAVGHVAPTALVPASAELLWQDYYSGGEGLIKSVSLENKSYVVFETPSTFHAGNAVIAVRDNSGQIIWNWHLWFVSDLKDQKLADATNGGALLYTINDRNLGAVSAVPGNNRALGLLYQWGRKDPFIGASGKGNAERTMETTAFLGTSVTTQAGTAYTYDIDGKVTNSETNMAWKVVEGGAANVELGIRNPMTFYSRVSISQSDWLAAPDHGLWGNPWEGRVLYPLYSDRDCNSGKGAKTIYDPCPPGYRVIPMDTWVKAGVVKGNVSRVTLDTKNLGYSFKVTTTSGEAVWFPFAGYRSHMDGTFASAGSAGFMWSSSPYNAPSDTYGKNASTVSSSNTVLTTTAMGDRSRSLPVRCCKE